MDPFRRVVSDRNHRKLKNGLKLNRSDLVITAPCISVGLATRGSSRAGRHQPTGATETNTDTRLVSGPLLFQYGTSECDDIDIGVLVPRRPCQDFTGCSAVERV
jgi:hypothetical protein